MLAPERQELPLRPVAQPRLLPTLLHVAVLGASARGEEGSTRRRVYAAVSETPGLHQRDLARRLELSAASIEHHLRHLVRAGLLARQRDGGFVRYYVAVHGVAASEGAVGAADKVRLAILRHARPLEAVARLLQHEEGLRMGDLAQEMGISPGTLTYQVGKLEKAGIVVREARGNERWVQLADRAATVELLLSYQPPADLVAGFEDLWSDVGF